MAPSRLTWPEDGRDIQIVPSSPELPVGACSWRQKFRRLAAFLLFVLLATDPAKHLGALFRGLSVHCIVHSASWSGDPYQALGVVQREYGTLSRSARG